MRIEEARRSHDVERLHHDYTDERRDRDLDRKARNRVSKVETYARMKQSQADAAATRLRASEGLQSDQIAAALAHEEPRLAEALERAFANRDAEERAALERRHAGELRAILEAARAQDTETIQALVEKLAGALATATRERAGAGDREARTTLETVRIVAGGRSDDHREG